MEKHDEEEDGEEVVRVKEDLVLGPAHFVGGRRVDDEHRKGHHRPGQVRSTLGRQTIIHVHTHVHVCTKPCCAFIHTCVTK